MFLSFSLHRAVNFPPEPQFNIYQRSVMSLSKIWQLILVSFPLSGPFLQPQYSPCPPSQTVDSDRLSVHSILERTTAATAMHPTAPLPPRLRTTSFPFPLTSLPTPIPRTLSPPLWTGTPLCRGGGRSGDDLHQEVRLPLEIPMGRRWQAGVSSGGGGVAGVHGIQE